MNVNEKNDGPVVKMGDFSTKPATMTLLRYEIVRASRELADLAEALVAVDFDDLDEVVLEDIRLDDLEALSGHVIGVAMNAQMVTDNLETLARLVDEHIEQLEKDDVGDTDDAV